MKVLKGKKKAMTIVEMGIAIGIMSIVIVLVFSFVNSAKKRKNNIDIRQELQFDCTYITENLTKEVLESKGIGLVDIDGDNINKIKLLSNKGSEDDVTLVLEEKDLTINKGRDKKLLSENIKSMQVLNWIKDKEGRINISKMNSIHLKIELEKKGVEYNYNTELYFRNFK